MFNLLDKISKKGGIDDFIRQVSSPPSPEDPTYSKTLDFSYDEKREMITQSFIQVNNDYSEEEVVQKFTINEILHKKLQRERRRDILAIQTGLTQKNSDLALKLYIQPIIKRLNEIIKQYKNNKRAKERPYIKQEILKLVDQLTSVIPEEILPDLEPINSVTETRGNPAFKDQELSRETFIQMVEKANELLNADPDFYKPVKTGAFIGERLTQELMSLFNLKRTRVQEYFRKNCKKSGHLFELKNAY